MSLPMTARPPVKPKAGVCRVCGCTDRHACHGGCSWVDSTLCSRCHGPRHPTIAQAGEISRIRERLGPLTVRPSKDGWPGCVDVVLTGTDEDRAWRAETGGHARVLVLDVRGWVVGCRQVRA